MQGRYLEFPQGSWETQGGRIQDAATLAAYSLLLIGIRMVTDGQGRLTARLQFSAAAVRRTRSL